MFIAKTIAAVLLAGNLVSFLVILRMYLEDRQPQYLWIMGVQVLVSTVLLGVMFYHPSNDRRAEWYKRQATQAQARKAAVAAERLAALEQEHPHE